MKATNHFLLATISAYGHLRPAIGLMCRLIQADPNLLFTVLAIKSLVPVINREIHELLALSDAEATRIRVIGYGHAPKPPRGQFAASFARMVPEMTKHLQAAYIALVEQGVLTCTLTGKTFDYGDIPPPQTAFMDPFTPAFAPFIKERTPQVKVVALWVLSPLRHLQLSGPKEYGGMYGWEARTKALFAAGFQMPFDEIARSLEPGMGGAEQTFFDGLRMYDYESWPQALEFRIPVAAVMNALRYVCMFVPFLTRREDFFGG